MDESPSPKGSLSGPSQPPRHNASLSNGSASLMPGISRTQTTPNVSITAPHGASREDDDDDEDDEQAWAKMRMAREQLKGSWKFKKSSHGNLTEVAS
ncbi:hypothetical protein KEM56_002474 [Ascosphaera pollenicola]|nr:hypothetical protein KEM56_002474 [Ascosphaera pollenicola]